MIPKQLTTEERANLTEKQRRSRHEARLHHCRINGINAYNHMEGTGVSRHTRPCHHIQVAVLPIEKQYIREGKKPRVKQLKFIRHY